MSLSSLNTWYKKLTQFTYQFRAIVSDGAGNSAFTKAVPVVVDHIAPSFSTSAVTLSATENSTDAFYTTSVTDSLSGEINYTLAGTDAGLFSLSSSGKSVSIAVLPTLDYETHTSAYHVNLVAKDLAGNSTSQALTINPLNGDDLGTIGIFGNGTHDGSQTVLYGRNVNVGNFVDPDLPGANVQSIGTFNWQVTDVNGNWVALNVSNSLYNSYYIGSYVNGQTTLGRNIRLELSYSDDFGLHTIYSQALLVVSTP